MGCEHVQRMLSFLAHGKDDTGAECPGCGAWHLEGPSGAGGHEPPTVQEWLERTQEVKRISSTRTAAQVIRELRDAR
jgi:hypothetical protein